MNKIWITLAILLGLAFGLIGYVYASRGAANLPHYFPGYTAGSDHIHVKHSVAAFAIAAACFVFAWFKSGPKKSAQA